MSVDLPEPEGPTTATYSPGSTRRLTPRRACTTVSPIRYERVSPSASTAGTLMARPPAPSWQALALGDQVGPAHHDHVPGPEPGADLHLLRTGHPDLDPHPLRATVPDPPHHVVVAQPPQRRDGHGHRADRLPYRQVDDRAHPRSGHRGRAAVRPATTVEIQAHPVGHATPGRRRGQYVHGAYRGRVHR